MRSGATVPEKGELRLCGRSPGWRDSLGDSSSRAASLRLAMRLMWLDDGGDVPRWELERAGVVCEHIEAQPEVYNPAIDRLMQDRGYRSKDIVDLRPDTAGLDDLLAKFCDEHLHTDDEVRYVLAGEGIFDIRSADDRWMRITVNEGDLVVVPANRWHRFFLTERKTIRCLRLFKDSTGWAPHYR